MNDLTKTLTNERIYNDARLLNSEEVERPTVTLISDVDLTGYNYAKIDDFGRSYFARVEVVRDNLYRLSLESDVLSSRADAVKSLTAVIGRNSRKYNSYFHDNELTAYSYRTVQTKLFSNPEVFAGNSYVLVTV